MSKKHPVIVVTGSSGAGTTTMKTVFEHIFFRQGITPLHIDGDSFHRYNRQEMSQFIMNSLEVGEYFSHFGPEANLFDELSETFKNYSDNGQAKIRHYIHTLEEAEEYGVEQLPGTFTEWEEVEKVTDCLFYEGLHGAVVTDGVNIAQHADLKLGVVPIINLEWIQKLHRDTRQRGYCPVDVTQTILRRMNDYIHYIMPQFSETDINFQRVPVVDTSNPFAARDIPTQDESMVVIRFRDPEKFNTNFPYLLSMVKNSFMSRRNTIVVPGGQQNLALEIILGPIIKNIMNIKKENL